jgi:hypothetical protein
VAIDPRGAFEATLPVKVNVPATVRMVPLQRLGALMVMSA